MLEPGLSRRSTRGPSARPIRTAAVLGILSALGAVAAGCSSSPATHSTATTGGGRPPPLATTSSTTSTTTAPATTAPAVQSTTVQVQISGSTATITFTSASVSGSLSPVAGTFSQGGTLYTFSVKGVTYSGSPSTTSGSGGLITSVVVSGGTDGPTITVKLSSPASHANFGLGHNEIGVQFS